MQDVQTSASARHALRTATKLDHDRTEAAFEALDVHGVDADFALWLRSMHDLHCRFGGASDHISALIGLPSIHSDLLGLIAQDFEGIGSQKPLENPFAHQSDDQDQMFGIAYAIEGSGMGARVLRARAKAAGGHRSAYIEHLSVVSATRWPIFMEALDMHVRDIPSAIHGAQSVFRHLEASLKSSLKPPANEP